ncbi:phage tail protein [Photorhabdus laumondii subsp. laumondii]|uniref:Phage tail protein n=1 Tax=Photorhabdus laumondii subsp. laumondii TaxID=141679 RepID=A0A6L9JPY4_PHOLM|nr:phage tail protein [Photorhabdus laumondii]MCC8385153.1 phage tail protein [Photorhabdus laumondii]MCC8413910.1 phage tail protein [Photorhabdus laumondii]NDK92724.1 phage tail protein [Photorhabdus laumondii subsp. laumondii]NDL19940.1 phage tail protein [Photorhabdus laumondii subsp. laumondii]NDL30860.1 phage tail protein [Photorhabdus laumondii subsp. laumondii]
MTIEVFTWYPRTQAAGGVNFRVRKAQFGDGYTQVAGDGINPKTQNWELSFIGNEAYIRAIVGFLDHHAGHKSFQWEPPLSDAGLYRCNAYKTTALGGGNYSLSANFIQAYHP